MDAVTKTPALPESFDSRDVITETLTIASRDYRCQIVELLVSTIPELAGQLPAPLTQCVFCHHVRPIAYRYGNEYQICQPISVWLPDLLSKRPSSIICALLPPGMPPEELNIVRKFLSIIPAGCATQSLGTAARKLCTDKELHDELAQRRGKPRSKFGPSLARELLGKNAVTERTAARIFSENTPKTHSKIRTMWNAVAKKKGWLSYDEIFRSVRPEKIDKAKDIFKTRITHGDPLEKIWSDFIKWDEKTKTKV